MTDALAADYDAGSDLTQFALRFESDTDGDGETEYVQFGTTGAIYLLFYVP